VPLLRVIKALCGGDKHCPQGDGEIPQPFLVGAGVRGESLLPVLWWHGDGVCGAPSRREVAQPLNCV